MLKDLKIAPGPMWQAPGSLRVRPTTRDLSSFVVHSHLRWDFVWQRPQQILSRLAEHSRILFVEEPMEAPDTAALLVTEPHRNVVRVVPLLPAARTMPVDAQQDAVALLLLDALQKHPQLRGGFAGAIHWFYSPMSAPRMLGALDTAAVVYDCMDELANFRFAPPDIAQRERVLLDAADVVFTGGYHLYQAKSSLHGNVHFLGCGVDVEHFGKARALETPVPEEVARLPRPVFGYFGVIDERLDYDLLVRLAERFPLASLVMLGPTVKVEQGQLPQRPNIHWLGQQAYADLPAFVKAFDVCLMPFALNDATRYINPTKTLEYMAAGKPIVSTAVPDVLRNFAPIVAVASTAEMFIDEVALAHERQDRKRIAAGIRRASAASWDATVEAMRRHILDCVDSRAVARAPRVQSGPHAVAPVPYPTGTTL